MMEKKGANYLPKRKKFKGHNELEDEANRLAIYHNYKIPKRHEMKIVDRQSKEREDKFKTHSDHNHSYEREDTPLENYKNGYSPPRSPQNLSYDIKTLQETNKIPRNPSQTPSLPNLPSSNHQNPPICSSNPIQKPIKRSSIHGLHPPRPSIHPQSYTQLPSRLFPSKNIRFLNQTSLLPEKTRPYYKEMGIRMGMVEAMPGARSNDIINRILRKQTTHYALM
jgi:hypothetical protein